jgi:hypothetical protein
VIIVGKWALLVMIMPSHRVECPRRLGKNFSLQMDRISFLGILDPKNEHIMTRVQRGQLN